jgi:hypothetical protein
MTARGAAILLVLLAPACGDDSGGGTNPDGSSGSDAAAPPDAPSPPDAMVDASRPDADPNGPDLVILGDMIAPELDTITVDAESCEVDEMCVTGLGQRTILRFDTWSYNQGNEDLVVGTPDPASPVWQYSACHDHFHYLGFAVYELLNGEGVVASGHKQAFCLLDLTDPPPDSGPGRFDCGYQGISAGWADVYSRDLPCQWIDVTDIPPGTYTLRIALNPERNLFERDYGNNLFETPVTIE